MGAVGHRRGADALGVLLGASLAAAGCATVLGIEDPERRDDDAGKSDAGTDDARGDARSDARNDGTVEGAPPEGGVDGGADAGDAIAVTDAPADHAPGDATAEADADAGASTCTAVTCPENLTCVDDRHCCGGLPAGGCMFSCKGLGSPCMPPGMSGMTDLCCDGEMCDVNLLNCCNPPGSPCLTNADCCQIPNMRAVCMPGDGSTPLKCTIL
jgi:hypothetical protein